MAESSRLTLSDIYSLDLDADAVSLTACNSGAGTLLKGEGVVGMTRAFMYAGTRMVAVTLWSVESKSVRYLSVGMFAKQQAGKDLVHALQQVKIDMLGGKYGAQYRHPRYWAPLVVFGQ